MAEHRASDYIKPDTNPPDSAATDTDPGTTQDGATMVIERELVLRCPVCLSRENDVVLLPEPDPERQDEYYCVKCSFVGDETSVRAHYAQQRQKYIWRTRRFTVEEQAL